MPIDSVQRMCYLLKNVTVYDLNNYIRKRGVASAWSSQRSANTRFIPPPLSCILERVCYALSLEIVCSSAIRSISGSTLPRRSALRKIPSQALALK